MTAAAPICKVDGCDRLAGPVTKGSRGYCGMHYSRIRRSGDPGEAAPRLIRGTPEERFWSKVNVNGPVPASRPELGPCWLWKGFIHKGYGQYAITAPLLVRAHRFAYELLVGPIPQGLHLDHLCRVRSCVNPAHLEPVTCKENLLRGDTFNARNVAKTHCLNGHEYTDENTYLTASGGRCCRLCGREYQRQYRERVASRKLTDAGREMAS